MRILIVEDDLTLADGLTQALARAGYAVTCSKTGGCAEHLLLVQDFDVLVLDLGLPDMDGREVLQKLRARELSIPVLILTARDGLDDRVQSLEWGADDYLIKPFELRELEARIHALIRRTYNGFTKSKAIVVGRLALDTLNHQVMADGKPMILFSREYGVLEMLMLHAGRVVRKDRIAQRLSGVREELADNAIEVYIHRLRKRIETFGIRIRTVRGLGYLLENCVDE